MQSGVHLLILSCSPAILLSVSSFLLALFRFCMKFLIKNEDVMLAVAIGISKCWAFVQSMGQAGVKVNNMVLSCSNSLLTGYRVLNDTTGNVNTSEV